jgi:pimeloyl-ACP methyl ester carboxylesterase
MALISEIEYRRIKTNGITLHVAEAGPKDGEPVILLHGFPEFWYGWRHQIDFLANAGYRVVVPDQRGYNLSDKPRSLDAYALDQLAADLVGLIDDLKQEKVAVIGHDWGAGVAWWTAMRYPERLERMVIVNVPHPGVFLKTLPRDPEQLARSVYIFFFQLPWLPEFLCRQNDWKVMVTSLRKTSRPDTFTDEDLALYKEAWSQPGAITAMINWYRAAAMVAPPRPPKDPRIHVPTLMIWGTKDTALKRSLAQPSIDLCDDGRLVFIEGASHFVQHEEPDRVNTLIHEFLSQGK